MPSGRLSERNRLDLYFDGLRYLVARHDVPAKIGVSHGVTLQEVGTLAFQDDRACFQHIRAI